MLHIPGVSYNGHMFALSHDFGFAYGNQKIIREHFVADLEFFAIEVLVFQEHNSVVGPNGTFKQSFVVLSVIGC